MRVWMIAQDTRPPVVAGITRHYALGRELVDVGDEVLVVNGSCDHLGPAFPEGEAYGETLRVPEVRSYDGVRFLTIPAPRYERSISAGRLGNNWLFGRRVRRELMSERYGRPDVIVGSTVHPWAALAGLHLAKHFGVPFVYEVRDLWPQTLVDVGKISRFHPLVLHLGCLDRRLAREASCIVTSAPFMHLSYVERFGTPPERFLWIPNGTRVQDFDPSPPPPREVPEIFYTGGMNLSNRVDSIFDAVETLAARSVDVRWTFVGRGGMRASLERRAREGNLPVRFLDPVPKREMPSLLRQADAFAAALEDLSIYRYGISLNKLADYFAAGRPVFLLGSCSGNPVEESGGGWTLSRVDELVEAVASFRRMERGKRLAMGVKARSFAESVYDWRRIAASFRGRMSALVGRG